jgi:hypothetical protein
MANPEVAAQAGSTAADSMEKNFREGERDLTSVFDEINKARQDETTFPDYTKAFSAKLNDGNDLPELRGFELVGMDNDGDAVFSNANGARVQYDAAGNRVEQWGKNENDREFTINPDGTATHTIKAGETVWAIAKDICRARKGAGDVEVSNAEVAAEVKRIEEANKPPKGKIADINKVSPDQDLIIPAESVREVKAARGESHIVSKDGKISEITYPNGRSTSIERDDQGVSKIVENGPNGKTEYVRGEDGNWTVTEPNGETKKYPGKIEVCDDGTIIKENAETGEKSTQHPNGTVVVEKGETTTITAPDGTVYQGTKEGWTKTAPATEKDPAPQPQKIDADVKVDAAGNVSEVAKQPVNPENPENRDGKSTQNTDGNNDATTNVSTDATTDGAPQGARGQKLAAMQQWLVDDSKGEIVYDQIDKKYGNGDGSLDDDEIEAYIADHKSDSNKEGRLTPEQELYLKELANNDDYIEDAVDDEGNDQWAGISKADLQKWTDTQIKIENKELHTQQVKTNAQKLVNEEVVFLSLAGDDGVITGQEVAAYIMKRKEDPNFSKEEMEALQEIQAECGRRTKRSIPNPKTGDSRVLEEGKITREDRTIR